MNLQELFAKAGVRPDRIEGTADVSSMTMDSRRARPGSMFVVMPSQNTDANAFIGSARDSGATSVITYSAEGFDLARRLGLSVALLEANRYQDSLWRLAKFAFGNPTASMRVIGVTGTNGKTTTAWLIRDMLRSLGIRAAYLGTLGFHLPGEERELNNTTPFAVELNELLAEARDKGVEALTMEVSSHSLAEKRVDGIEFDAAVFTNLTQDHLDFHGSMDAYEAAKLRLMTEVPAESPKSFCPAINVGDPVGRAWAKKLLTSERHPRYVTFEVSAGEGGIPVRHSSRPAIRLYGHVKDVRVDHIEIEITSPDLAANTTGCLRVPLGGSYNVENCLSAAAGMVAAGFSLDSVREVLPLVRPVPGRFEAVPNQTGIGVLVDYAHTPDALEKLLDAVRPLTLGRVITVFGCGGDRDRNKRPKMARAASERSDLTVVTSDNPRTEDPQVILNEVRAGVAPGSDAVDIIDRREAIAFAIGRANPGDVVVIAGKGHENYQIIGRTKYPMDDRELARNALDASSQP